MKSNKSPFIPVLAHVVVSFALFAGSLAQAATTSTWTGSTTDTDWATGANWGGTAPAGGNSLAFTSANASSSTTLTDSLANAFSISGITFNSGALAYTMTGNSLTLTGGITNSSTSLETIDNALALSSGAKAFASGTGGLTIGGIVSGAGGITASGSTGVLTLSGVNIYTGATTISSGTVVATNASSLGASTAALTIDTATLDLQGGTTTAYNTTINGTGTIAVDNATSGAGVTYTLGTLTINHVDFLVTQGANNTGGGGVTFGATTFENVAGDNNSLIISSGMTLTLGSVNGGVVSSTVSGGGNLDVTGVWSGSGAVTGTVGNLVVNDAGGTVTLSAANTYTGVTTIDAGTVALTGAGSIDSSNLVFASTGTFSADGTASSSVNGLTLTAGMATVSNTGTGTTLALGAITRSAGSMADFVTTDPITTTNANTNGILGAWAVTGTGTGLTYAVGATTSGTATNIAGLTAFTGTNTTSGMVAAGNYDFTAAQTLTTTQTANTLRWAAGAGTLTFAGTNTLNGLMNAGSGTLTVTGGTLQAGTSGELDIVTNNQNIAISSVIAGSALAVGSVGGNGTVTLTGVNTYTGATYVNSGTLTIGGSGDLNKGSYAGAINVGAGATFNYDSTVAQTFTGSIEGGGSLAVNGTGTVTLTGSNGYTGNTTLGAGTTLIVTDFINTQSSASTISIGSGATLDFASAHSQTLAAVIAGTGNLIFDYSAAAFVNIEGNNTFTGTTTLASNLAEFTGTGSLSNSAVVFTGDAVLEGNTSTAGATPAVNGVTIDAGLIATISNNGTQTLSIGAINRVANGGILDFVPSGGVTASTTTPITTTTGNTNGILGTGIVIGTGTGLGYATSSGGIVSLLTGTADNTGALSTVTSATGNYTTSTAANTNTSAITANTLQFSVIGAETWTNTGGATLNGLMNSGSGDLTESGGTITIGANQELDIVTNTTNVNIGSVIADNAAGASSLTFGSIVGQTGTATPAAGSTLTLTGVNTYTGATDIAYGTLAIGGAGQLGSGNYAGAVVIGDGATFDYNSTAAQVLTGDISGPGALIDSGTGTLTLSGTTNNFGGSFTVGAGSTLQLGNSSALYNATAYSLIFTGNGTLADGTNGVGSSLTLSDIVEGSTGGVIQVNSGVTGTIDAGVTVHLTVNNNSINGGGTLDLLGALTDTNTITIDDATLNITGTQASFLGAFLETNNGGGTTVGNGVINISGGANVDVTSGIILFNGNGGNSTSFVSTLTITDSNVISGFNTATPTTFGHNTVVISNGGVGENAFLYLNSGTLETGEIDVAVNAANSYASSFYFNGGTVIADENQATFIAGIGSSTVSGLGAGGLNNTGGVFIGAGGATINSNGFNIGIGQALLTGTNAGSFTIGTTTVTGSSASGDTLDGGLTKEGLGTLTLSGENTYNGGTTITGGTLQVGVGVSGTSSALGATTGSLTIDGTGTGANGTLDLNGFNTTVGAVTLGDATNDGSVIIDSSGTTSATLTTSDVTVVGTDNTIGSTGSGSDVTVVGNTTLSSGSALTLDANGQITGTVAVGTGGATLSGSGTVFGNATLTGTGVIDFSNSGNITGTLGVTGGNWNGAGTVTGVVTSSSGNFNIGSGANLTATSGVDVTGGTISSSNATGTITGGLDYTSSASSTFAGVIAGTGALTLNSSTATLTLTGTNTYTGGTIISAGTLALATASTTGSLGGGDLTVNGSGILDLEATTQTVDGLNGTGTITNLYTDGRADPSSLIVGNGGDSGSFSGSIEDGALSNTSLTKEGAGTQVLSGENQYSGGTTITGGILSISSEDNLGNADGYFASIDFTPAVTLGGGELLTTATTPITEDVQLDSGTTNTLAAATGTTATYNGVVEDASSGNPGALTVGDSHGNNGTVVLSNANTYTGGTTVSSGTLEVANGTNGSATGSGALTVESTGTLVGIGTTVSSSFSISGNVIAGSGLASDTTGQTVIEGGAALHNSSFANATLSFNLDSSSRNSTSINIGATGVDFGGTTMSLTFQGGNIVAANTPYVLIVGNNSSGLGGVDGSQYEGIMTDASGADGLLAGQYKITGGLSLSFANYESLYGDNSFLFLNTIGGVDDIEVEVIPEPGTWALMLSGVALLVFWQRRKNQG